MKILSKELKTFLFILTGICFFVFGFNFLKGRSFLQKQITLYTTFSEIEGLVPGAKVSLNGLTIGSVTRADFVSGRTDIIITMNIRDDININRNSIAVLYETGLIGGKAISIEPNYQEAEPIVSGDTLPSKIKPGFTELVNRQIAPLQEKIVSTLTSVDSLFNGVSNVLNENTQNNLKNTLENLSISLENINKASIVLSDLLISNQKNFSNTMDNLSSTSNNLTKITDSIASISFINTIEQYEKVAVNMNDILKSLKSGSGTAGKLINDDSLYFRLTNASKSMELLLNDLKNNPKRYVHFSIFGKKDKSEKNN